MSIRIIIYQIIWVAKSNFIRSYFIFIVIQIRNAISWNLYENTFCIYAEIADLKIPGAAAYMFKSFCADGQLTGFSRINTMDDFAMPNVARAKQAYHPSELINSYTVSLKIGPPHEH